MKHRSFCSLLALTFSAVSLSLFTGCHLKPSDADTEQVSRDSSWDVNDISVLYPLRSFLTRSESKGLVYLNEGLLSQQQFQGVLSAFRNDFSLDFSSGAQASLMNRLDLWAVVAMRIHSCFRLKATDPCQQVINLVTQPVIRGESSTGDFAMHLTYSPSKGSAELLKEMISIRNGFARQPSLTLGKPLGVHPILESEGLESAFARSLKNDFLLKNLSSSNLSGLTVSFVEPNRLQPWVFFSMNPRTMSVASNHSIFMFDPGTSTNDCGVQQGRLICRRDSSGKITDSLEKQSANPTGATPSGFAANGNPYVDDFLSLVQTERDTRNYPSVRNDLSMWRDVFNRIENPNMTAPDQTNCSSCHRTTTDRIRFRGILDLSAQGANAFKVSSNSGCTPGVAIDYNRQGMKVFNVRIFGYLHDAPIITKRVENETLLACEILKRNVR